MEGSQCNTHDFGGALWQRSPGYRLRRSHSRAARANAATAEATPTPARQRSTAPSSSRPRPTRTASIRRSRRTARPSASRARSSRASSGTEPGTADPAPLLAESWDSSEDGLSHTFTLKEGVTFHDGTPFDAEAVCSNFDRWYNWTGLAASEALGYYYDKLFRGYADTPDTAVYKSCTPDGENSVTIELNQPFAGFIPALSLPAFAMQSPTALEEYDADGVGGTAEAPTLSEYGTAHPTGTGPYKFDEWAPGEQVTLSAYEDYWGDPGQIDEIIFRVIDEPDRSPSGARVGLDRRLRPRQPVRHRRPRGRRVHAWSRGRPSRSCTSPSTRRFRRCRIRACGEALSYAIDKDALISQVLPEGTEKATQFVPDDVNGYNPDVTTYEYDPEKAKELLAEAGYTEANPLTLTFNYPVAVSRPYMPTPEQTFTVLASQLRGRRRPDRRR